MNEHIKFLADKTGDMMPGVYSIEYESDKKGVEFTEDALEKFVELILKECISYINDSFGDIDYVKFMIKRNFGVEE